LSVFPSFCGLLKPKKIFKIDQKEANKKFNYEIQIGENRFK
jgi:hypothetical protein